MVVAIVEVRPTTVLTAAPGGERHTVVGIQGALGREQLGMMVAAVGSMGAGGRHYLTTVAGWRPEQSASLAPSGAWRALRRGRCIG